MRNVLQIFRTDLRHLFANTVATIVTIGLIIVPPMYAWLTTLGFWNPYGNTGGLEVAVANDDEGYSSALIPSRVDVGDTIMSELHENDQFDWVFCSSDEVEEGVRSGKYYAGIVIPKEFSADLMSVMSASEETPELIYYVNQKENAIASHVTATGASVLQTQIDESFAKTVADVTLSVMHDLTEFMSGEGLERYGSSLLGQLQDAGTALDACLTEANGIQGALSVTQDLLSSTSRILDGIASLKGASDDLSSNAATSLSDAGSALDESTASISADIQSATDALARIQSAADDAFNTMQSDPAYARQLITDAARVTGDLKGIYADARNQLASLGASTDALTALDAAIASLDSLTSELTAAESALDSVTSSASGAQASVNAKLDEARTQVQEVDSSLAQDLTDKINALQQTMSQVRTSSDNLASAITGAATAASGATDGLAADLTKVADALTQTTTILTSAKESISSATDQLSRALASGDIEEVRKVVGSNTDALASFISAPTELVKHAVYEVPNNGDSMSPFYSSLSLWVGAIFLIALANVNVSRKEEATLEKPRAWELYLGRYGAFLVLALLQAFVLFIGNVLFLQIQCEHPIAYLGTLLLCAVVFSNLVYTLNISFGNVGKAIAIILLVMQLAGTGGIMPIQTSAPIFQAIYPWLPFTHAISALASCASGIYGNQLVVNLALLAAFLVPSLLLGLALRNPMIRANAFIQNKLNETKLI